MKDLKCKICPQHVDIDKILKIIRDDITESILYKLSNGGENLHLNVIVKEGVEEFSLDSYVSGLVDGINEKIEAYLDQLSPDNSLAIERYNAINHKFTQLCSLIGTLNSSVVSLADMALKNQADNL